MTCHRFTSRKPMSYRASLRKIPKALRRQWWEQRYRYAEPRTPISRLYGIRLS
ncbi:hypothetical protein [Paraburkholderia mimosarum]|uniref:hypothetical protein n=1 Tax=Paraburkholderia mimosarum TaxID=312026 RepID=UPI0003FDB0C2|nr:hypothetical protein [Paraburkholderia mimosarum]